MTSLPLGTGAQESYYASSVCRALWRTLSFLVSSDVAAPGEVTVRCASGTVPGRGGTLGRGREHFLFLSCVGPCAEWGGLMD